MISPIDVVSLIWALVGLVAASSLAIYLWRRPDASVRIRHKESEMELGRPISQPSLPAQRPQLPPGTAESESPPSEIGTPPAATEVQEKSRFAQAYKLLTSGQYEQGIRLLEEEVREESEIGKQVSLIAFGQYLAAEKGIEKALDDLRRTAGAHPGVFDAQLWLGEALARTASPDEAEEVLLRAYSIAASDTDRATALVWRARDSDDPSENIAIAEDLLVRSQALVGSEARSRVYARAGKLFLEAQPPDRARGLALYELAIHLAPADSSLRFEVAHALSDAGAEPGALLHYSDLLARDSTHDSAFNNFGVSASNLGMKAISVDSYKRAEMLGNTLAAANLAWVLINAGFLGDARAQLEPHVKNPQAHRNVLGALGGLAKKRDEEEGRRESILKQARQTALVRREMGISVASGVVLGPEVSGTYVDDSNHLQITVVPTGAATGVLQTQGAVWDLAGRVVGAAVAFMWATHRDKDNLLSSLWTKHGNGLFVKVGEDLRGYTYEGNDYQEDPANFLSFREWRFYAIAGTCRLKGT